MTNKEIRQAYDKGKTVNQLCNMSGMSKSRILRIVKGK
jgi:Mor family transcriptional regulator